MTLKEEKVLKIFKCRLSQLFNCLLFIEKNKKPHVTVGDKRIEFHDVYLVRKNFYVTRFVNHQISAFLR